MEHAAARFLEGGRDTGWQGMEFEGWWELHFI